MFSILGLLLATVTIYILRFHHKFVRALWISMKLSGPRAYPIIGNGTLFMNNTSAENFAVIGKLVKEYGDFFRIWIGTKLMVIVSDPKDVEVILNNPRYIEKSMAYDLIKPWLNEGLLLSSGKKWFERRRIITPTFHFKILDQFVDVFDRLGTTFVNKLKDMDSKEDIEIYPLVQLYALDVICETAMGVHHDALSKPNSPYVKAVQQITNVIHTRVLNPLLRNPIFFKYSSLHKQQKESLNILHGFTDSVIQQRREELVKRAIDNDKFNNEKLETDDIGVRQKRAFLDSILSSTVNGKPLDDIAIREEVDTFMFTGHDTTTSAITFCLYNIARTPEVQKKCFEEIVDILGEDVSKPTTLTDLNRFSYLDLVIKETLRLFPVTPLIARSIHEDINLSDGRLIPAGSNVMIPIYSMNHNEKNFADPEAFIPERFSQNQTSEKRHPYSYIPFSAGPRNCIGQKFAIYEIKCIISKLLRNFELEITKESEAYPVLSAELILKPENRISINFKPRIY